MASSLGDSSPRLRASVNFRLPPNPTPCLRARSRTNTKIQLLVDGKPVGTDLADVFHHLGAVAADEERGRLVGIVYRLDGRLAVRSDEFFKRFGFDLRGNRVDDRDDVASHVGVKFSGNGTDFTGKL